MSRAARKPPPRRAAAKHAVRARRRRRVGRAVVLRLYITGATPNSGRAVENIREICKRLGNTPYELQIIDIYQQPHLAREHDIIASPTLLKQLPRPARRLIGDLSEIEHVVRSIGGTSRRPR